MIKSLYVHIPFCIKKCLYCDFNSYTDLNLQDFYIESLINEIKKIEQKKFKTIFVGGGTPTILSIKNLKRLLIALEAFEPDEYTFESNPGTLNDEKLRLMRYFGVNRISIGLQAWQDNLLKALGRIHSLDDFLKSYDAVRKFNFSNVNIDLMFAIPNQTIKDWIETIENVYLLKPEHISCYSLIIEKGTPFYDMYSKGSLNLVDEDIEREMYWYVIDKLKEKGMRHYEISNLAKPGFECSHNITYWKDDEYIGVGAGAHSYAYNRRYSNLKGIKEYIEGIENGNVILEESTLSIDDTISEYMFMGLRMMRGISKDDFKLRFKMNIEEMYNNEINGFVNNGLLIDDGKNIFLTKRGIDISNRVFTAFLR